MRRAFVARGRDPRGRGNRPPGTGSAHAATKVPRMSIGVRPNASALCEPPARRSPWCGPFRERSGGVRAAAVRAEPIRRRRQGARDRAGVRRDARPALPRGAPDRVSAVAPGVCPGRRPRESAPGGGPAARRARRGASPAGAAAKSGPPERRSATAHRGTADGPPPGTLLTNRHLPPGARGVAGPPRERRRCSVISHTARTGHTPRRVAPRTPPATRGLRSAVPISAAARQSVLVKKSVFICEYNDTQARPEVPGLFERRIPDVDIASADVL